MGRSQFAAELPLANRLLILYILNMRRFAGGLFAMLLFLPGCATVASGPRLSPAHVRRIADAKVLHIKKVDPRQYEISGPHYIAGKDCWSVIYSLKANKRRAFTVRVPDKIANPSTNESDAEIFEGSLNEKPDNH